MKQQNKFVIIKTKVGYGIQNTQTMSVIGLYKTEAEAIKVASKLNS